ncbi:MAG TPA: hypothetical protein VNM47_10045 [Terriglobia bacterium]|nr:hypothetical protein [Terriglobia bacterium]
MEELAVPFDPVQIELYRKRDPACIYHSVWWPQELRRGRERTGEFPLVVVREHFRRLGYTVLASEPRLPDGQGFILLSFPRYRERRHPAYTQMASLLGTDIEALDAFNLISDKAKIAATGNRGGGDPDLFVYRPDGTERFFVEVKHKDKLNKKQLVTFPIIRKQGWEVKIVRIVEASSEDLCL